MTFYEELFFSEVRTCFVTISVPSSYLCVPRGELVRLIALPWLHLQSVDFTSHT